MNKEKSVIKPIDICKTAASMVVAVGVGLIVGNAIKATTPVNLGLIHKICIKAGSFALTTIAGNAVGKAIDKEIDNIVASVKTAIKTDVDITIEERNEQNEEN